MRRSRFQAVEIYMKKILMAMLLACSAGAAEDDKGTYTLVHPVPEGRLRELNPDRPDKTEGPFTVDAGHLQVELDWLTYTRDHDTSGAHSTRWSFAPVNLKLGLLNNVDAQLIVEPYDRARVTGRDAAMTHAGFGDVTARCKINFWGNDGGPTALGLLPFVKLPTNQDELGNRAVEGGVILPFVIRLPGDFELGAMTECDCTRNEQDDGYYATFINSITLSHDLPGKLGGYVEFFSAINAGGGSAWIGTVDAGLTWQLTENLQLDIGLNVGVTPAADDLNLFTGLTLRH